MSYIGVQPTAGQYRQLDDISGSFNGTAVTFTTSVGGLNVTAGSAEQLLVSLGGVIQKPDSDYSVSTNSITFTTAPSSGLDFFAVLMGDAVNVGTPADGSVTSVKLASDLTVDLASGSAASPSLTFDANTGLYSPGADEVAISTNGTGRLFIDSSGNVGIGTSPGAVLDVNVGSSRQARFAYDSTSTSVEIYGSQSSGFNRGLAIGGEYVVFNVGSNAATTRSESARITADGKLGLGTTSPSGLLHCYSGTAANNVYINTATSAGYDATLYLNAGTSGGETILNMGFGSDPDYAQIKRGSDNSLRFQNNNSERARIDSSGRLLVGTSSNSGGALLQVNTGHVRIGDVNIKTSKKTGVVATAGNQTQLVSSLGASDNLIAVTGAFSGQAVNAAGLVPPTGTRVLVDYGDIQLFMSAGDGGSLFIKRDAGSGGIDVVISVQY